MRSAHRRRPIRLRRPLAAALAVSLAAGPLLLSAPAHADRPAATASTGGASDQPPDQSERPGPSVRGLVRPQHRAPGVFVIDADAATSSGSTFGEPSIAINPANTQQIAITRFRAQPGTTSTNQWTSGNAHLLYSTDGGISWADEATIPVPPGVSNTNGAPCDQTIDYGQTGTLYGTFLTCSANAQVVSGSTTDPTKASSWLWNNPTPTTTQLTTNTRNNTDQPWLIVNRDTTTASQDNVYVGFQDFANNPHDRVTVSRNASPVDFPAANDQPAGTGALQDGINGGLRLAPDRGSGTMYALYQQGGSNNVSQPQPVTIKINRSTDAGATWTLGGSTDGITVASVNSDQGNQGYKFGGDNALIGGVHHAAVDPTDGSVFVAYGVDVSGTNQIRLRHLTDDGMGSLAVGSEVNVSTSTNTALPSVAVLSDGTVGVLYLSNDGSNTSGFPIFTAHLARSTDHGATFTDTTLQTFTMPKNNGNARQRVFGDYQQLKSVGTTFYGAFMGNLNGTGQTTVQPTDTIFFSVPQFTKTTLSSSANPSAFGQAVTFTATVTPVPDSGKVQFKVDGTDFGSPVTVDTTTGTATSQSIASLGVGDHHIDATFTDGPDFQDSTAPTLTQTVACANTITGEVNGGVRASGAATCIIGADVHGAVRGVAGGALFISGSTIHGEVKSSGGTVFGMCDTTVTGGLQVSEASGFVVVGDPGDDGCAGNRINGTVRLVNNHGGAELIANQIGGSAHVNGTTGTGSFPEDSRAEIEGNTIGGGLNCTANNPDPTNDGSPNSVSGGRTGQCSTL